MVVEYWLMGNRARVRVVGWTVPACSATQLRHRKGEGP